MNTMFRHCLVRAGAGAVVAGLVLAGAQAANSAANSEGAGSLTEGLGRGAAASTLAPEVECDDGDTRTSVVRRDITVNGKNRFYWLSVPPGDVTNAPLLVYMHGFWTSGAACDSTAFTGWPSYSIDSGRRYVVIYPATSGGGWDYDEGSPDVAFVRAAVAEVSAEVSIDPNRIYASGHSTGANIAQRLACDTEDLLASVAVYSGIAVSLLDPNCELSRGIAVGLWHGDVDQTFPISDGRASRDEWATRESCTTRSPASGEPTRVTWSGCRDNVKVEWTVLTGQDHAWPSGASNDVMRSQMWALFDSFPLP